MKAVALLASMLAAPQASAQVGTALPPLPGTPGVAGAFAGVSGGALVVAGGANFPERPPWEGGRKAWSDRVLVLDRPDGRWRDAGKLPRPLGYGVSATHRGRLICVGGSDASGHHAEAFALRWDGSRLTREALPPLPAPLANSCGALVGDVLYVAGGLESPESATTSRSVHRLDLAARVPAWEAVPPCPGPGRMLAAAGSFAGSFWLFGGVDLVRDGDRVVRRYLADAYRYDPRGGWSRLPDLPHPLAAAPTPAATDRTGLHLMGGDDGSHYTPEPRAEHPGFDPGILRFDPGAGKWTVAGRLPSARVTTPLVPWKGLWVVPSGEVRPGVRSADVWALTAPDRE